MWIHASCSWNVPKRAQEVIDRSCEQKVLCEAEVVDGEERLAEAANRFRHGSMLSLWSGMHCVWSKNGILVPAAAQGTWMGCGPPRFDGIPPIPTSGVQDFAAWMIQWNCELRNAIEFGDPMLVAKIGGLLGQGVSVFLGQTDISDNETIRTLLKFERRTLWFKGFGWERQVTQVSEARGSSCHQCA